MNERRRQLRGSEVRRGAMVLVKPVTSSVVTRKLGHGRNMAGVLKL
jgi:hypothetical protein